MRVIIILVTLVSLVASSSTAISSENCRQEREPVTVSCRGDQCKELHLWNSVTKGEGTQFERLGRLRVDLINNPPGLVRSIDREQTLEELIATNAELGRFYREMLELERK